MFEIVEPGSILVISFFYRLPEKARMLVSLAIMILIFIFTVALVKVSVCLSVYLCAG